MIGNRHKPFITVLLLFVSFRLLAILTLRTGGFVADFSDYDFYYAWGQLSAMGYETYNNLWTAYPPLFPTLMLPIFDASSRIPPWIEPRFFFHLLFGLFLLIFETGNLILIYRLALRLAHDETFRESTEPLAPSPASDVESESSRILRLAPADQGIVYGSVENVGLWSAILYALLFVPAYTLLGWFETMPLFFMLLSLDLLLIKSRWSWPMSAIAVALGFLVKLTPALLIPIAIRWFGAKLSWRAARDEWFNRNSPGNLLRPTVYTLIFFGVVLGLGYWLVDGRPALALSSFRIQSIRPPWQSLWALLDGYYGYGLVPLDMRNLVNFHTELWQSRLPWTWITLGFIVLYFWLYTRRYDWTRVRTPIAFSAVSVIWLFLYSKGWSPQFLVWILAFIVLLMPTLRAMFIAVTLSIVNVIESYVFLIILPDEEWLMTTTVLIRTALLLLLAAELLGQIWPKVEQGMAIQRWSGRLSWATLLIALLFAILGTPRAAEAYQVRRWAEEPCQAAIAYLQDEAGWPNQLIVSEEIEIWRDFYPWLQEEYDFRILDTYSPLDEPAADVLAKQLDELASAGEFWWIEREPSTASATYFDGKNAHLYEEQILGDCRIFRATINDDQNEELGTIFTEDSAIHLTRVEIGTGHVGTEMALVLYWMADTTPTASYTVFTQLLDPSGQVVAQQDNIPVEGLAPTNTWTAAQLIRDPYQLALPEDLQEGEYQLLIGMYDSDGRQMIRLPDGTEANHLSFAVPIENR